MSGELVGNLFGKDIYLPIKRTDVRELIFARDTFIKDLMSQNSINEKQAHLDASDMVLEFYSTLKSEDLEVFKKFYDEENTAALSLDTVSNEVVKNIEANFLEANFIYNQLSANLQVYGSNSSLTGATPANIDLALQHIDRCLEVEPNNARFLNLKGLLLIQGKKQQEEGIRLLTKASELDPTDINIQHNLKTLKDPNGCFIATAAYGTPLAYEINELRYWRDTKLSSTSYGKVFIKNYYKFSPPIANYISQKEHLKKGVRIILKPLIKYVKHVNQR